MTASVIDPADLRAVWRAHPRRAHRRSEIAGVDFDAMGTVLLGKLVWGWGIEGWNAPGALRVLEYGVGGGANVRALGRCTEYVGVDIVPEYAEEAARGVFSAGWYYALPIDQPSDIVTWYAGGEHGRPTLILSTYVFQHLPSKPYTVAVLDALREIAAPDARLLVNVRISAPECPSQEYRPDTYAKEFIRFTAWGVEEFWSVLRSSGYMPRAVTLDTDTHIAWFAASASP